MVLKTTLTLKILKNVFICVIHQCRPFRPTIERHPALLILTKLLACTLSPLPKFSPARDIIIVIIYLCSHLFPVGKKIANLCRNLPRHAIQGINKQQYCRGVLTNYSKSTQQRCSDSDTWIWMYNFISASGCYLQGCGSVSSYIQIPHLPNVF